MPIYEYRCKSCENKVSVLVKGFTHEPMVLCNRCHSTDLRRLVSSFAFHRSWGKSLDLPSSYDELSDSDEENPQDTAQWMRKMRHEMGGEVTHEYNEMIDTLEQDEMPQDNRDNHQEL